MATTETAVRELTYGEAVREAIAEEMRRDPRVFLIGEDVAEAGHPFKTLVGLVQEFGTDRIIDTPISEPGYAGIGVGAAMTGMRPVVDVMFGDFITLTMDQMVNQAAKAHYMSGGKIKVPIVFRTTLGATRRSAAQHSQSLHAWVSHIPGLKVALPSGPYEAKGLMKTAIRDDSPVVIFEDKMMYRVKGPVPAEDYTIPFGVAEVKRVGTDITIVATSSMVAVALGAAKLLEEAGISAEVIDPRTTWPLDKNAAVFLPSGTMCNEIALRVHARAGEEVIAHHTAHPIHFETGGPAALAGVNVRSVDGARGQFDAAAVEAAVRPSSRYAPRSRLVWVEQTSNLGGGSVWPLERIEAVTAVARR